MSRQIYAQLSYSWEFLEDTKARRLKRYGDIAEELKGALDPEIDIIINLVLAMQELLQGNKQ